MSAFFALIQGEGASPQVLSRKSEFAERPPHPDPLHSPSKTGVNALKASGEREQAVPKALPASPIEIRMPPSFAQAIRSLG